MPQHYTAAIPSSVDWLIISQILKTCVQSVMSVILKTAFLPYVNLHLRRGFPLPLPHGFTLQNAEIFCINYRLVICSDIGLDRIELSPSAANFYYN